MKRSAILLLAAAVVAAVPLLAARAGDPTAEAGAWVFDVRVVRVDMTDPTGVEAPVPWEGAAGAVTSTPYPDMLAVLKHRGQALVMLDQRVTAVGAIESKISQDVRLPLMTLERTDKFNVTQHMAEVHGGCTVTLSAGEMLRYGFAVNWYDPAAPNAPEGLGATQFSLEWRGTAPVGGGGTLVLHHREQRGVESPVRACEVYCFLTARRAP